MSALSKHYFVLGPDVKNIIEWGLSQLRMLVGKHDITIGVSYRGGDKMITKCIATTRMSCGNVTLHSEAAYESYLAIAERRKIRTPALRRPKLLLMTIEPGMKEQFQNDPIGRLFDVVEMPTHDVKKSFLQSNFDNETASFRLASTRGLMASLETLALYADAFIVSANSNLGRVAMLRGSKKRWTGDVGVHPFDIYFYPTLAPVLYPACNGTVMCDF